MVVELAGTAPVLPCRVRSHLHSSSVSQPCSHRLCTAPPLSFLTVCEQCCSKTASAMAMSKFKNIQASTKRHSKQRVKLSLANATR